MHDNSRGQLERSIVKELPMIRVSFTTFERNRDSKEWIELRSRS